MNGKWQKNVAERIQHESGPAEDFMQSFLTPKSDLRFFFNTEQLSSFPRHNQNKSMYRDLHTLRRSACSLNNTRASGRTATRVP